MARGLEELRAVMDRLRSPGGCPWDAEQTHESLLKYLLEEAYEFSDAVHTQDRDAMREELGDVLLQAFFHSRIAEEHPTDSFTIDDVAEGIATKLKNRHPHVFGDEKVSGSQEVLDNWEALKAKEKGRTSALDGVAMAQPALPLTEKLIYRAEKYGVDLNLPEQERLTADQVGEALVKIIAAAHASGVDAENALRAKALEISARIAASEER